MGVRFSIDDVGTGYSSLPYLTRLPIHALKIDRAFTCRLGYSERDDAIIKAIINLGRTLGIRVVAEGVKTEMQREELTRLGCTEIQGYLISRPVTADEVSANLALEVLESQGLSRTA